MPAVRTQNCGLVSWLASKNLLGVLTHPPATMSNETPLTPNKPTICTHSCTAVDLCLQVLLSEAINANGHCTASQLRAIHYLR